MVMRKYSARTKQNNSHKKAYKSFIKFCIMKSATLFVVSCVLMFFVLHNTKGNIYICIFFFRLVTHVIKKHCEGKRFIQTCIYCIINILIHQLIVCC